MDTLQRHEIAIGKNTVPVHVTVKCPHCGLVMIPIETKTKDVSALVGNTLCDEYIASVLTRCSAPKCKKFYLSVFLIKSSVSPRNTLTHKPTLLMQYPQPWSIQFDVAVTINLPRFISAYNDAMATYSQGMEELAGCGFRRALEYMIHDYALEFFPDKGDHIENPKTSLSEKIGMYCDSPEIRALAKASSWLGNDFVHPVKRHDQTVAQLIQMVDACAFFIAMRFKARDAQSFIDEKSSSDRHSSE